MSSLPLWGGKNQLKKKKKGKTQDTDIVSNAELYFLQCNSIKPKLQVLTRLIRLLAQLTHHKEEIQPWTRRRGLQCLLPCSMSSAHTPYFSTWSKNLLLSPSQPQDQLALLLFLVKISESLENGWAYSTNSERRCTEHFPWGLNFPFDFSWLVFGSSWGTGISTIRHAPCPLTAFSLLSPAASHSLLHGHTARRLPSAPEEVLTWLAGRVLSPSEHS